MIFYILSEVKTYQNFHKTQATSHCCDLIYLTQLDSNDSIFSTLGVNIIVDYPHSATYHLQVILSGYDDNSAQHCLPVMPSSTQAMESSRVLLKFGFPLEASSESTNDGHVSKWWRAGCCCTDASG